MRDVRPPFLLTAGQAPLQHCPGGGAQGDGMRPFPQPNSMGLPGARCRLPPAQEAAGPPLPHPSKSPLRYPNTSAPYTAKVRCEQGVPSCAEVGRGIHAQRRPRHQTTRTQATHTPQTTRAPGRYAPEAPHCGLTGSRPCCCTMCSPLPQLQGRHRHISRPSAAMARSASFTFRTLGTTSSTPQPMPRRTGRLSTSDVRHRP